jgi:hypothetical protein
MKKIIGNSAVAHLIKVTLLRVTEEAAESSHVESSGQYDIVTFI